MEYAVVAGGVCDEAGAAEWIGGQLRHTVQGLGAMIPAAVRAGCALADEDLGGTAPGLGIANARHETQYTRLFRS
jgi:urease accessory protein UreF